MLLKGTISYQAARNVKEEHVLLRFLKSCRKYTMQLIFHAGFGVVTHSHLYTSHHVQPNTMPRFENKNMNLATYFSTAALEVRLEKHSTYQMTSGLYCAVLIIHNHIHTKQSDYPQKPTMQLLCHQDRGMQE